MEDNISKIKDRLSVVDVISGYIKTQKSGVNFKARCPFHNEKTPSFYISPERQIWHCFGCQKGGDIFGFIKEIEGVEFPEALRILAQKAGVELESFNYGGGKDDKAILYEISEAAAKFFEKQLHYSNTGKMALSYLIGRGLTGETIRDFRLGYAPNEWSSLSEFLNDRGYKDSDIVASGLAIKRDGGGGIYDRFRSRIVFPIFDVNDRIAGFTARIFESAEKKSDTGSQATAEVAKYVNTPQTAIYDKSRILYGLNKAKLDIRKNDSCVLVEGNMDAIMSYQAGVKNVVASSGTALTPSHLRLLQRYTGNLSFCFDLDQAGSIATRRGIGLALGQNFNIKMVRIDDKECKDPADFVKKYGSKWNDIVRDPEPVVDFYFNKSKSEFDFSSPDGKKKIISVLAPLINRLTSRVEKSHWISKLALLFRAPEKAVEEDLISIKDDLAGYESSEADPVSHLPEKDKFSPADRFSREFLAIILKNPKLFAEDFQNINYSFLNPLTATVIQTLSPEDLASFKPGAFAAKLDEKTAFEFNVSYLESQELWGERNDDELKKSFYGILNQLEKRVIMAQLTSLSLDIQAAEVQKDKEKRSALLAEFDNLTKKLPKLQG